MILSTLYPQIASMKHCLRAWPSTCALLVFEYHMTLITIMQNEYAIEQSAIAPTIENKPKAWQLTSHIASHYTTAAIRPNACSLL